MSDREDVSRIDATGTMHPVGRFASQYLRARPGEWQLVPSPPDLILFRRVGAEAILKIAGEIRTPGGLCDVVALAAQSGWVGELFLISHAGTRSFFFEQGVVIWTTTSVKGERLGEMLVRYGILSEDEVEQAMQQSTITGRRLGESAIDLSLVSSETLYPMMAKQAEEVFYAALHVSEGAYYFFDRFDEGVIAKRHHLNASALLMEGARRMDEMHFFREKIPSRDYVPVKTGSPKTVPEGTEAVYAECDGKKSIAKIGDAVTQVEFEVTRSVFQLLNAGLVTVTAPRPDSPQAVVEAFNPALIEIHVKCDATGRGGELRDGLSRFAVGAGIYDPLFSGAGPLPDGSFKPQAIARNVASLAGSEGPEAWLAQLLYEYVGFALFQAESLVIRSEHAALTNRVMELLRAVKSLAEGGARG